MVFDDVLSGAALLICRQTGLDRVLGVRDKLAWLVVWREGIHAHLTAAIALGEKSRAAPKMPNQSLLYARHALAVSQLSEMMNLMRGLCGRQMSLTPSAAVFDAPETADWLRKYYGLNQEIMAEKRRKLMAFNRDLVNSDCVGHRLAFQLFGQSPPHAHLSAVYHHFDWEGPLALVRDAAGLEGTISGKGLARVDTGPNADRHAPQMPKRQRSLEKFEMIGRNSL